MLHGAVLVFLFICLFISARGGIDEEVAVVMRVGDNFKAITLLESLGSEERTSSRLISLARAYSLSGQQNALENSERVLKEHIEAYPKERVGYVSLAKLLIHMQRVEEAEAVLRKGKIIANSVMEDASFLTILGKSIANNPSSDQKARAEALEYALKAEEVGSKDAMVQYELGMLFFFLSSTLPLNAVLDVFAVHTKGRAALTRVESSILH